MVSNDAVTAYVASVISVSGLVTPPGASDVGLGGLGREAYSPAPGIHPQQHALTLTQGRGRVPAPVVELGRWRCAGLIAPRCIFG